MLASRFSLSSLSSGQQRFDRAKLDYLSRRHLERLDPLDLASRVGRVLELRGVGFHPAQLTALAEGLRGAHTLTEAADEAEQILTRRAAPADVDEQGRAVAPVVLRGAGRLARGASWPRRGAGAAGRAARAKAKEQGLSRPDGAARAAARAHRVRTRASGCTSSSRPSSDPTRWRAATPRPFRDGSDTPELRLYDSLTQETGVVEPRNAGELSVYVCGPTVYNYVHVGNARPFWLGQVLRRFVTRRLGWTVRLVVNITDVDDKIYQRAREQGVSSTELAARYREAYVEDTDAARPRKARRRAAGDARRSRRSSR